MKSDMHDELMVREQLEEDSFLSLEQMRRKTQLIHSLMKINEEELYWFKRSHEKWLLEGDNNTECQTRSSGTAYKRRIF